MDESRYELRLLGSFGLFAPDGSRIAVSSRKGMALIALVALARSGERSRAWLQARLWGSRLQDQASASLRRELANLRIAVNRAAGRELIVTDTMRVRIDLDLVEVDVRRLELDVSNLRAAGFGEIGELLEGIDIPGEEAFEDWLREQRGHVADLVERLREQEWDRAALGQVAAVARPNDGSDTHDAISVLPAVAGHSSPFPAAPVRPTVAVLPLACQSDDDAPMAQAMTEDMGDALARFSTLRVVSAGGQMRSPVDHGRLCREMGVRYLLEGSVRRDGEKLLIVARLIDGVVGEQLWAQRFDAAVVEVFAVQDQVASAVAQQIDSSIDIAERRRAIQQPVHSFDAYSLYWRANAAFRKWEPAAMHEAIDLAEQVLKIEPHNSWASALAAFCHAMTLHFGWAPKPADSLDAARRHYDHCLTHGSDDPFVLGYAAGALVGMGGDPTTAEQLIDRALAIHPNSSANLFWGGWIDLAQNNVERAIERFDAVLLCNPRSAVRPLAMTGRGLALLGMDRAEEALIALNEASPFLARHPLTAAGLALVHMRLGDMDAARDWATRLDALGTGMPRFGTLGDPRAQTALSHLSSASSGPPSSTATH